VVLILAVAGAMAQTSKPIPDLDTLLASKPHYSMIRELINTAGLMDTLNGLPEVTLFLPTNAALSGIEWQDYEDLKQDMPRLTEYLKYHVTTDQAWHTNKQDNDVVFTSLDNNLPIRINVYKALHTISAEGVNITEGNMRITNGFVHGLADTMWPPEGDVIDLINSNDELSTTAKFLAITGLDQVIRNDSDITVFAPTDEAWEELDTEVVTYLKNNPALLEETLLYHVVAKTTLYSIGMRHAMTFLTVDHHKDVLMLIENLEDGDFFLNHAFLDERDLSATNGVIHTIGDVLIPSSVLVQIEDAGLGHQIG